jgi:hypothetical protein
MDAQTAVKQSVIAKTAKNIVTGERYLLERLVLGKKIPTMFNIVHHGRFHVYFSHEFYSNNHLFVYSEGDSV